MGANRLPQKLTLEQLQNRWSSLIDPVLMNPVNNSLLLKSIPLVSGANVINHKLGRDLQGWYVTRMRSVAISIYDTQDSNQMPDLTLNLNASAPCVVDLVVF